MNKVCVEVTPPEAIWCKGSVTADDDGTMSYQARFCKPAPTAKPIHQGPVVTLIVRDSNGKELQRQAATILVKTDGKMELFEMKEALSDLEKPETPEKAEKVEQAVPSKSKPQPQPQPQKEKEA